MVLRASHELIAVLVWVRLQQASLPPGTALADARKVRIQRRLLLALRLFITVTLGFIPAEVGRCDQELADVLASSVVSQLHDAPVLLPDHVPTAKGSLGPSRELAEVEWLALVGLDCPIASGSLVPGVDPDDGWLVPHPDNGNGSLMVKRGAADIVLCRRLLLVDTLSVLDENGVEALNDVSVPAPSRFDLAATSLPPLVGHSVMTVGDTSPSFAAELESWRRLLLPAGPASRTASARHKVSRRFMVAA
ncbi:hypothetical protein CDD83_8499 [Cordyceps sp. RAO-2017]|nr:hypothetical protein CDD83_8499 [Cordyceps sp. RAO-2017]